MMHIKISRTHPVGKAPAPTHPTPDAVPNKTSPKLPRSLNVLLAGSFSYFTLK